MVIEKAQETEIKLPTSSGSSKKQESSRKISISALLTMPKPLTLWITTNWKILKEMGIPDHLTYFLRNLYAGQEATVKTGHGTTDWFQVGKGVHVLKWRDNQKAWASDLPQLKQQEKTLWGPSQARTICKPGRELAAETELLGSSNHNLLLLLLSRISRVRLCATL